MPADAPRDYQIGYKKPPVATRFKKGNRANPRGSKNLATLLERALDAAADTDASETHGRLTKRELVVARLVERSAGADLAATKLLFELLRKVDPRMVTTPADPPGFAPADDPIAQVRAKLLRLARAQGLVPASDDPEDVPLTADPAPVAPDQTDLTDAPPDDDPIVQVRAKLERLARAQGLVPPSEDPDDDPPTADRAPFLDATHPADISGGTE